MIHTDVFFFILSNVQYDYKTTGFTVEITINGFKTVELIFFFFHEER